jgi:hypothetical protein
VTGVKTAVQERMAILSCTSQFKARTKILSRYKRCPKGGEGDFKTQSPSPLRFTQHLSPNEEWGRGKEGSDMNAGPAQERGGGDYE